MVAAGRARPSSPHKSRGPNRPLARISRRKVEEPHSRSCLALDQSATLARAKIPHWPRATEYLPGRPNRLERLAANNVAVEKAKLAENIYKTTNPLKETPGVPEGWKDISNDNAALSKIGLNRNMLFDRDESPDFWQGYINRIAVFLVKR